MGKTINKRNILIIITMALAIATSIFILVQAGFDANKSTQQSGMVVEVVETVVETVAPGTITEANHDAFAGAIRKIVGHFLLFSVAGFFATWTILLLFEKKLYKSKLWFLNVLVPLIYGISLASISEVMQLFAKDRSGEFRDVIIDFGGYSLGFFIIFFILILVFQRNTVKNKTETKEE